MIFDDNDDIEVLDLEEDNIFLSRVDKYKEVSDKQDDSDIKFVDEGDIDIKKKSKKKEKKEKKKASKNKVRNKKVFISQLIFCSLSLIFIISCFVFYGGRLFKYYRIYNPKPTSGGVSGVLLANKITSRSEIVYEGSGLYISGGNYIYKGEVSNNYIKYNNLLWRIVKINKDDTINIILDDYINVLGWDNNNSDYVKSDIYNYLNDYYLDNLNKDLLAPIKVCVDKFDKLSELSCNNQSEDIYVNLLDVSNFLNSVVDGKTYLANDEEIVWLSNQGTEKIWHTNGSNVSMSEGNNFYEVRPMVTLKTATVFYGGDGTIDNPYVVEEEKKELKIGSYVKLGEDIWNVYDLSSNIKLSLANNLEKQYHFSYKETSYNLEDKDSLADYLNTTYLEELTYKDILIEDEWYNGKFDGSYKDVMDSTVKAKVGILNLMDLKFDSTIDNYLLMTSNSDDLVYTYGEVLKTGKPTIYRNIRPCISISKNTKIKSGKGSLDDPYVLEV